MPMPSDSSSPRGPDAANLRIWRFGGHEQRLGAIPLLMGIVNVTPDSFSDGGQQFETSSAVRAALTLAADGADILDIGGESTRPGAAPVALDEELRRVIPVIEQVAQQTPTPISVDTSKAEVARRALEAGATIVNDVSGLRFDRKMPEICANAEAGVVCMHMQGTPQTMQVDPRYDHVVQEICEFFRQRMAELESCGIPPERVVLDPGIGFGKTARHNLEILSCIQQFRGLGRPVLIGHSRKRFLGNLLGRDVDMRMAGTLGVSLALAMQSVDILRVHDVRAHRDALVAWREIRDRG